MDDERRDGGRAGGGRREREPDRRRSRDPADGQRDTGDAAGDGLDRVAVGVTAGLSVIAMGAVMVADIGISAVVAMDPGGLLRSAAILLAVLPLPAAYIAHISHDGFRRESLGTLAALPFAALSMGLGAVAAGLVLGGLLVSYKATNLWDGGNPFWTGWKASGGMVVVLALAAGLMVAATYQGSATFREDIRGNLTNVTTEVATDQINLTQRSVMEQQTETLVATAGMVARNVSESSILLTGNRVMGAVEDDGSFSPDQQNLLITEFDTARQDIPPQVAEQTRDAVRQQLEANQGGLVPVQDTADMIAEQTRRILQEWGQPTPLVLAAITVMVMSLVLVFKLPFSLIAGLYAVIIGAVSARLRRQTGPDRV